MLSTFRDATIRAAESRKAEEASQYNDIVSSEAYYEDAVEGGVHTSTPLDFSGPKIKPFLDDKNPSNAEMQAMEQV